MASWTTPRGARRDRRRPGDAGVGSYTQGGVFVRTNIDIDDGLIREAMEVTGATTKKDAVTLALHELVARRRRRDLRDLFGQVDFTPGYDHKALREGRSA